MTSQARPGASSAGPTLRALHAVVFVGLCGIAFAAAWPEWLQLVATQRAPFHFGESPRPLPLLASALCGVALLAILFFATRRRPVPLVVSALVLVGFLGTVASLAQEPALQRNWAAADLAILGTARAFHAKMVDALQKNGRAPEDEKAWRDALLTVAPQSSPARDRSLRPLPYQLVWQPREGGAGPTLTPGQLWVRVGEGGQRFELTPVGFDSDGRVAFLTDEKGAPVVLRGAYNPDLAGSENAHPGAPAQ